MEVRTQVLTQCALIRSQWTATSHWDTQYPVPGGPPFCRGAATHPVKFIWPQAAARRKLQTRSVCVSTAGSPGPKPPAGAPCMLPPPGELQGLTGMAKAKATGPRSSWRPAGPPDNGRWALSGRPRHTLASGELRCPFPLLGKSSPGKGRAKRGGGRQGPGLAFFPGGLLGQHVVIIKSTILKEREE